MRKVLHSIEFPETKQSSDFDSRGIFLPQRITNNVGHPPENLIRSCRDRVLPIAAKFRARVSIVFQPGEG